MPRIGGGSGPIIPPQAQPTGAQNTQQTQKSGFAERVAAHQGTDAARAQQAKDAQAAQLTGKTREIAKRLKAGTITQKEATREFVGLVIEERFPQFKKRKREQEGEGEGEEEDKEGGQPSQEELIEEAVSELIERDPVLAKQLERQLKKLAG